MTHHAMFQRGPSTLQARRADTANRPSIETWSQTLHVLRSDACWLCRVAGGNYRASRSIVDRPHHATTRQDASLRLSSHGKSWKSSARACLSVGQLLDDELIKRRGDDMKLSKIDVYKGIDGELGAAKGIFAGRTGVGPQVIVKCQHSADFEQFEA